MLGSVHRLDGLARGALDRAQHAALARRHEQDRLAGAAGAAGAADAVHVALGVVRDVVVQHVADAVHVEAARGDVGGDQHVDAAVLQLLHGLLALLLLDVAVERGRGDARARAACSASSSVPILVRANTIIASNVSASSMRVIASSL